MFGDGSYIDIGTPEDLTAAAQKSIPAEGDMIIVDTALEKPYRKTSPISSPSAPGTWVAGGAGTYSAFRASSSSPFQTAPLPPTATTYRQAGIHETSTVETVSQLEDAIAAGEISSPMTPFCFCRRTASMPSSKPPGRSISRHGWPSQSKTASMLSSMNAELDATVGPLLKTYADRPGRSSPIRTVTSRGS